MGLFDFLFGKAKSGGSPKKGLKRINLEKRFDLSAGRTGQGQATGQQRSWQNAPRNPPRNKGRRTMGRAGGR